MYIYVNIFEMLYNLVNYPKYKTAKLPFSQEFKILVSGRVISLAQINSFKNSLQVFAFFCQQQREFLEKPWDCMRRTRCWSTPPPDCPPPQCFSPSEFQTQALSDYNHMKGHGTEVPRWVLPESLPVRNQEKSLKFGVFCYVATVTEILNIYYGVISMLDHAPQIYMTIHIA